MRKVMVGLFVLMVVLHQDCWFWENSETVMGFIPVGLFYHALFSIAVAILGAMAIRLAWPVELEQWASEGEPDVTVVKEKLEKNHYDIR